MILHCSQKLAAKLPDVSPTPLEETSPLVGWHGHLFTLDRRQCVMFCHDATRYALFLPGLQKVHFAELGSKGFRPLYLATLAAFGCTPAQINKGGAGPGARGVRCGYRPFGAGFDARGEAGFGGFTLSCSPCDGTGSGCRVLQT
jgi:hypothetical protein